MMNEIIIEKVIGKSVTKRKKRDGKTVYAARFVYLDQTGKRREIGREARTRNEAKDKLQDLLVQYETLGTSAFVADQTTLKQLIEKFDKDCIKEAIFNDGKKVSGYKSVSTLKTYAKILTEKLGSKILKDISYSDIKQYKESRLSTVSKRTSRCLSFAMVHRELAFLRRVLNYAVENRWLALNPFMQGKKLIQLNLEKKRSRILTEDEEARLLSSCTGEREHLKAIILCALDCGFRRKEITTLTWADTCFEHIQIGNNILRNGFFKVRSINSKTGEERPSAISDRLYPEISKMRAAALRNADGNEELLAGRRIFGISEFKRSFNSAKILANLEDLRFHDLRHVLVTRLSRGGMSESEAMKISGHRNREVFDRYNNVDMVTLVRQQNALDNYSDNSLNLTGSSSGEGVLSNSADFSVNNLNEENPANDAVILPPGNQMTFEVYSDC